MTDQPPPSPPPHSRFVPPRAPYLIRSAETWDVVRRCYLRGETAKALAERFGVSVWNIRRRAGEEGWTRRAHVAATDPIRADASASSAPGAPILPSHAGAGRSDDDFTRPFPQGPEAETLDPLDGDPDEAKTLALAAIAKALRAGRYADAERLGKLAEALGRMTPPPPPDIWTEHDPRLRKVRRIENRDLRINMRWQDLDAVLEETGLVFPVVELLDDLVARVRDWRDGREPGPPLKALNLRYAEALGVWGGSGRPGGTAAVARAPTIAAAPNPWPR